LISKGDPERVYVSVVIPTFNSEDTLADCLSSVLGQDFVGVEVIVVDNYSTDGTVDVAESFGSEVVLFRGMQAAARNMGLLCCHGEFVLFLDSDQKLSEGVIQECFSLCSGLDVDAVKIPEVFVGLNFWGSCSALWKNGVVRASGLGGGIPRFYRRSFLVGQSGFKGNFRWGEDQELYDRLLLAGLKEVWGRRRVFHFEGDSLGGVVRKYASYGGSLVSFKESGVRVPYGGALRLTLSTFGEILRGSNSSFWVFVGCMFLVALKGLSGVLGFLVR
jgi:glycosyltransferase involved in cell wall biosynthesis